MSYLWSLLRLGLNVCSKRGLNTSVEKMAGFSLSEYGAVCFDFDHTLVQYNLEGMLGMQYRLLRDLMVSVEGYPAQFYPQQLAQQDIDFIQKGLFLDVERGNLLKIRWDGVITKCCHGTRELSSDEMERTYGEERRWQPVSEFIGDPLSIQYGKKLAERLYSFADYTDAQASLIFAKTIDGIDSLSAQPPSTYQVWGGLLRCVVKMFEDGGGYMTEIASDTAGLVRKVQPSVIQWIHTLRNNGKKVVLITGSPALTVSRVASAAVGADWKDLFDVIVYRASKPAFFREVRSFRGAGPSAATPVDLSLAHSKEYSAGSWALLRQALLPHAPRALYIGDNPIQDVYSPSKFGEGLDAVGLVEELWGDGVAEDSLGGRREAERPWLSSQRWGCYLFVEGGQSTIWGHILSEHARLAVPSLSVLAAQPSDHTFTPIWTRASSDPLRWPAPLTSL